jgi:hypothetical protein
VTYSDAGDDGTYHLVVFHLGGAGLTATRPLRDGRALLRPDCAQPEAPNVAAVAWPGPDASRLVVAVAVPRGSTCASQGTFRAFTVSLPTAQVTERYDQLQAKREFRALMGEELLSASDECIRNPKACPAGGAKR